MSPMASLTTGVSIASSAVCSGTDQRKHLSSALVAFVNSPVTNEFPIEMAGNAENVSIWWRHHEFLKNGQGIVYSLK